MIHISTLNTTAELKAILTALIYFGELDLWVGKLPVWKPTKMQV